MIKTDEREYLHRRSKTGPYSGPAKHNANVSLLDLFVIVADRRRLIFRATVSCTLLAAVLSFLLPTRYTASATLLPPSLNSSLGSIMPFGLGGTASPLSGASGLTGLAGAALGIASPNDLYGISNPNDRYVGMLKSNLVEDAVINHMGLMNEYHKNYISDARKKLENRTDVNGDGKDSLIHISVEDSSPQRAVGVVNDYVTQFRDLSKQLAISEALQRREFFEQQMLLAKNNLADAEEALKRTEQSTGLIQLDAQAQALIGTAATLRAEIAARETMIQGMQIYATDQNAQLIQANRELSSLRAQLSKLSGSQVSADGLIVPKGLVPEAGLEYVRKVRDVKYYETIFDILARQYELAKIEEAKAGNIIQIVDPATIPDKRSFPKRTLIICSGSAIGFLSGIFLALVQSELTRMEGHQSTLAKITFLKTAFRPERPFRVSVTSARRRD